MIHITHKLKQGIGQSIQILSFVGLNFWNEFKRRLEEAVQFRIDLQLAEERENYYLLFGEGDHIPGLFIQKINNVILTQIYCNFWKANDRNCFQVVRNVIQQFFSDRSADARYSVQK